MRRRAPRGERLDEANATAGAPARYSSGAEGSRSSLGRTGTSRRAGRQFVAEGARDREGPGVAFQLRPLGAGATSLASASRTLR